MIPFFFVLKRFSNFSILSLKHQGDSEAAGQNGKNSNKINIMPLDKFILNLENSLHKGKKDDLPLREMNVGVFYNSAKKSEKIR